jgi:two-component system phosphate regulon sensor histidine kinase PhoR
MLYLIIRQKKLSEVKNDFISNMSHELKTPIATTLAAVQGMQYFDILKDDKKTADYLAIASEELKRLSAMVTKILNSTVFESSEFVIDPAVFNLKKAIEEVVSAHHLLGQGNVAITLNYNIPDKVFADRTHLQQAIANLVDNAVKYSDKPLVVLIECSPVGGGVEISIKDNGPGVLKEYQKQIFDKFFRIPTTNCRRVNGYGLGLNYVKVIVEKHQGSVMLKKSDSTGSTFTLFLPQ